MENHLSRVLLATLAFTPSFNTLTCVQQSFSRSRYSFDSWASLPFEPYRRLLDRVTKWASVLTVSFTTQPLNMSFTGSEAYIQLKSIFKGDLILPADDTYKESLERWSILAERPAGVVAFVRDEDDVSAAVKFAVEAKLEIAIRGMSTRPSLWI